MGTARAFPKGRPSMEDFLVTVSSFYTRIAKNSWSADILNISAEKVSQRNMPIGCLSGF